MDAFLYIGFVSAFVGVGFVVGRIVSSISRITEVTESHFGIDPLLGDERIVPLSEVVDLRLVSFLGFQTHATIRIHTSRFWSVAHSSFLIPVRGRFMSQQGLIKSMWNEVPSKDTRL